MTAKILSNRSGLFSMPPIDSKIYENLSSFDYNKESDRQASFEIFKNPIRNYLLYAKTGFHRIAENKIECNFCHIIEQDPNGENIIEDHLNKGPCCPLLRRRNTANVPINDTELENILPPFYPDICGPKLKRPKYLVKYEKYNNYESRLESFSKWPQQLRQSPHGMAEAGFFYTGKIDRTICFSCGGGVELWEPKDCPWEQHALWYEKCGYLLECKGRDYVKEIQEKYKNENEIQHEDTEEKEKEDFHLTSSPKGVCKICGENSSNVLFLPCNHLMSCRDCFANKKFHKCPICSAKIDDSFPIYLA